LKTYKHCSTGFCNKWRLKSKLNIKKSAVMVLSKDVNTGTLHASAGIAQFQKWMTISKIG